MCHLIIQIIIKNNPQNKLKHIKKKYDNSLAIYISVNEGNMRSCVEITSEDEIEIATEAVDRLFEEMQKNMQHMRVNSDMPAGSGGQLLSISRHLSNDVHNVSSNMARMNYKTRESAKGVVQVNGNDEDLSGIIDELKKAANRFKSAG